MIKKVENKEKKSRLVFDAKIARKLCKQNFPIVDIKPYRDNPEKTVFVFENTEEFQNALNKIMDEIKAKNEVEEEVEKLAIDIS